MDTGRRIASARHEAGYSTQEEFAQAVGVSVWTVRAWERKTDASRPDNANMDRIVAVTGKPRSYFFGEETATVNGLAATVERVRQEVESLRGEAVQQVHPGLDALAQDTALRTRHRIDDAELEEVRRWVTGQPIATKELALAFLLALRDAGL